MPNGRVALVIDAANRARAIERLTPVFDELVARGLEPAYVAHTEDAADTTRDALVDGDGALVWVDPIPAEGRGRTGLDAVLRDVAAHGVWVSAHPDTVAKMGTKEVLYSTRELGWGADTRLYRTAEQFADEFPIVLSEGEARVLKPLCGNSGIGVQKVQLVSGSVVRVQSARLRDEVTEDWPLDVFLAACTHHFAGGGALIDQPFQPRITEGIIRCYLVKREVVGFARQFPNAASTSGADVGARRHIFGLPSAKTMFAPDERTLCALRSRVESEWVPAMQTVLDLDEASLPALWDADFLLGPRSDEEDSYVLCEVNASSVLPFPPEAPAKLAGATLAALRSR